MCQLKTDVARALFDEGLVMFGDFKLRRNYENPNLPLSKYYIDLRPVESLVSLRGAIVRLLREAIHEIKIKEWSSNFEILADVPTAFTPIVAILSHVMGIPMISPRREKKTYGTAKSINGKFQKGQKVLLIDDLITDAGSKLDAIGKLEEEGLIVRDVVVLIDRCEGGREALENKGYRLRSIYTWPELVSFYAEDGQINAHQHKEIVLQMGQ